MEYSELYDNIKRLFTNLDGEFEYNGKTIAFFYDKDMEDYVASYGLSISENGEITDIITLEMLPYVGWGELLANDVIDTFTKIIVENKKPWDME